MKYSRSASNCARHSAWNDRGIYRHQVKEFNRLLGRGLNKVAALLQGKLEEEFEVDHMSVGRQAEQ